MLLAILLQAATAPQSQHQPTTRASSAPEGKSFSILVAPCSRKGITPVGNEVVVCGSGADPRRLPLPDERTSDGPIPSNPDKTGLGALAAQSTPCAALQGGCQVGFGMPLVAAAVGGIATAVSDGIADRKVRAARRRDAGKRIPIPLDDTPMPPAP